MHMPTLLLIQGFRFSFYSNEGAEPAHVHVTKGAANGKIWLEPAATIAYLHNFTNSEIRSIEAIITAHTDDFKNKWYEFFGS
jgi:hypothetical protein